MLIINQSLLSNFYGELCWFKKALIQQSENETQTFQLIFQSHLPKCSSLNQLRSKDKKLTRENFDTFFHLSGLWGLQMFRIFDTNKEGTILFEEFILGIQLMVKGTFQEKNHILFEFYDVDKTGGVSYPQLLKMIYSYPKQDLRSMITEEKFLQSIDPYQLSYYFGPQKELPQKNVIEEVDESQEEGQLARKASEYNPTSAQFLEIQQKLLKAVEASKKQKSKKELNGSEKGNEITNKSMKRVSDPCKRNLEVIKKKAKKAGSMLTLPTFYKKKSLQLTTNIAFLVKKYAAYIFKQLKLDKSKDEMNEQQFGTIISNHQRIFQLYFEGFHSYIWQINDDGPQFINTSIWIQGQCEEHFKGQKQKRYIKFIRTTLFVFNKKKDAFPIQVKNLQGLIVNELMQDPTKFGFLIRHRDGIYPEKQYYFAKRQTLDEWLRFLAQFKHNSIYNEYQIIERVGTGNYSMVYRGQQKNSQKDYAIKVIQKFKLSLNQKQVIKFECSILQLCHHPSIVKFYKTYNTKTHIYIVTQYLNEGDLFQYTKRNTFLQQYQAAIILKQLIQAIKYLNEAGLIHRDLKPENVMIMSNKERNCVSRVKIIDFGFAVYKSNVKNLGMKEKYAGTPGYVAPQIFNLQDYDQRIDMFSLGIIMYFMLCGHLPFYSPIYEQIVQQTKQCCISFKNAHWMNISDDAKDLLQKILTFKGNRINSKEALEHPWLQNIQDLSAYKNRNKRNKYI